MRKSGFSFRKKIDLVTKRYGDEDDDAAAVQSKQSIFLRNWSIICTTFMTKWFWWSCVCVLDTKHTGYVVFIWVTSSFLLRFLIEWKSRVCGLQITFCSWCKTTISLIRMYICGYIYLIDIFVGHDDYIEYEASALPIHTNTNILIRILIYRRR